VDYFIYRLLGNYLSAIFNGKTALVKTALLFIHKYFSDSKNRKNFIIMKH